MARVSGLSCHPQIQSSQLQSLAWGRWRHEKSEAADGSPPHPFVKKLSVLGVMCADSDTPSVDRIHHFSPHSDTRCRSHFTDGETEEQEVVHLTQGHTMGVCQSQAS